MKKPVHNSAIAVRTIDINQPLQALTDVTDYSRVRILVTQDGQPLGSVDIPNYREVVSAVRLRDAVVDKFAHSLLKDILTDHYTTGDAEEITGTTERLPADVSASIIVATYDRPDDLRQCLRCLTAQQSPRSVEIIVVDNNPSSGLTPPVVAEFPGVILINEPRKGLSCARNKGIKISKGNIVVATDDDVRMAPDWLEKLLAPFIRPEVMIVTGNILPLELETPAQILFESYGGLGRGFDRRIADGRWFRRFRSSVPTWELGATANAAFRASIFTHPQIGLLDEALGAGTPTGCSEDTYLFYKTLKAGYTIIYDPAAYVWHKHRRDMAALRRQIYNYSKGQVAYQLTTLIRDHDPRALVRLAIKLPQMYLRRSVERLRRRSGYPLSLIVIEIAGSLVGPWALWRSRRYVKRGRSGQFCRTASKSLTTAN